jgi:hypothetical protein
MRVPLYRAWSSKRAEGARLAALSKVEPRVTTTEPSLRPAKALISGRWLGGGGNDNPRVRLPGAAQIVIDPRSPNIGKKPTHRTKLRGVAGHGSARVHRP